MNLFPIIRQDSCAPEKASSQNVGVAFALVIAASLSTALGASLCFCLPYRTGSTNYFLAGSLAMAAGVMIYVSFVDIFTESVESFSSCVEHKYAYLYATLCFFGGILLCALLDWAIHQFENWIRKNNNDKSKDAYDLVTPKISNMSNKNITANSSKSLDCSIASLPALRGSDTKVDPASFDYDDKESMDGVEIQLDEETANEGFLIAELYESEKERSRLIRMGVFIGVAIALHNFPEGIATLIGYLNDPDVGVTIAIAIALHNIPEGICVAMPIYYSTKSKWKAFFWASLSGLSELLGAAIGYAALKDVLTPISYGVMFGIVAGIMIHIALKELLPSAHRYDQQNKVVTIFVNVGFIIMALSLVLFNF